MSDSILALDSLILEQDEKQIVDIYDPGNENVRHVCIVSHKSSLLSAIVYDTRINLCFFVS